MSGPADGPGAATATDDGDALLVVRGLSTSFAVGQRQVRAVNGVSFTLGRGATLGVVGESGSGKSVIARSLMGLLPDGGVTLGGSVHFEGPEMIGLGIKERRRLWGPGMAMVFQDPSTPSTRS